MHLSRAMSVTLANHGVLFLDELAEFIAPVLDSLASPTRSSSPSSKLISTRGDLVAWTGIGKAPCTREGCVGARMPSK